MEVQVGHLGVVALELHTRPTIVPAVSPGRRFATGFGFTLCHCRVFFQSSVYRLQNYRDVLKYKRR
jgi:hypothetical protein